MPQDDPRAEISACRLCSERFRATATAHRPNPIVWFSGPSRVLIASQAPGLQVHQANKPFWDRSGTRLRQWLGVSEAQFYDRRLFAILPTSFCFPGYNASGSDLPPPPICARTWHARATNFIGDTKVKLYVGGYAQKFHLGVRTGVTETVRRWRDFPDGTFVLPHPSWRNTAWLRTNPWFEAELLPVLRRAIGTALAAQTTVSRD